MAEIPQSESTITTEVETSRLEPTITTGEVENFLKEHSVLKWWNVEESIISNGTHAITCMEATAVNNDYKMIIYFFSLRPNKIRYKCIMTSGIDGSAEIFKIEEMDKPLTLLVDSLTLFTKYKPKEV